MDKFDADLDIQHDNYADDDERVYTSDDEAEQTVTVSIDARAYAELGYPDRIKVTVANADADSEPDDG